MKIELCKVWRLSPFCPRLGEKDKHTGAVSPRRGAVVNNVNGKPVLVCPNCDFEQVGGNIYSTPQLHVHLNLERDADGDEQLDYISRAERERREIERKMMLAKKVERFREEHAPPVISKGSKAIVAKYTINVDVAEGENEAESLASTKDSADTSHPISAYLAKPALERLAGLAKESDRGAQRGIQPHVVREVLTLVVALVQREERRRIGEGVLRKLQIHPMPRPQELDTTSTAEQART